MQVLTSDTFSANIDFSNLLDLENATNFISNSTSDTAPEALDWGPKRDPLAIIIPITIVYILTFISGVLGNISTCIVIAKNRSMHTATNYYLFSLAISDLLLLVTGLPTETYSLWSKYPYIFGEAFCVLQGFAAETSANATVLTITAFTVERYVAICHPFVSHTLSKLSRAVKFIFLIWLAAMCLAIPPALALGVVYEKLSDGSISKDHCLCRVKHAWIPHAFELSTFLFFVAPMSLITVLYILIGLQLKRSTVGPSRGNSVKLKHRVYKPVVTYANTQAQAVLVNDEEGVEKLQTAQEEEGRKNFAKNAQATKHVVKMLVAVVVAFFICWAPFHAQRLLAVYGQNHHDWIIRAFQILTYVSGVFYYLSTTVNPLLYHIMSHKFREAFKSTFKKWFRRKRGCGLPGGRCYASLSGRSSQVNSHSNTDSYSRQSSLRYLDVEMARLHDSRRPLVVSFRGKTTASTAFSNASYHQQRPCSHHRSRQRISRILACPALDTSLQDVLDSLNKNTNHTGVQNISSLSEGMSQKDALFMEVNNLQPTHICPLSLRVPSPHNQRKPHTKVNSSNCSSKSSRNSLDESATSEEDHAKGLCKSCTMPDIGLTIGDNEPHVNRNSNQVCHDILKPGKMGNKVGGTAPSYLTSILSSEYGDNIPIHVN